MKGLREPQNQMEVEIKEILDQLEKDVDDYLTTHPYEGGLDGPRTTACNALKKKAFAEIAGIKKKYGYE